MAPLKIACIRSIRRSFRKWVSHPELGKRMEAALPSSKILEHREGSTTKEKQVFQLQWTSVLRTGVFEDALDRYQNDLRQTVNCPMPHAGIHKAWEAVRAFYSSPYGIRRETRLSSHPWNLTALHLLQKRLPHHSLVAAHLYKDSTHQLPQLKGGP